MKQIEKLKYLSDSSFSLKLFHPEGKLSDAVQAIWSVSISPENRTDLKKWLPVDAGSGILFILKGSVCLDEQCFSEKMLLLPVSTQNHSITFTPGTELAGIRFHPGISTGIFNRIYEQPVSIEYNMQNFEHQSILDSLSLPLSHVARIIRMYKWLDKDVLFPYSISPSLVPLLTAIQNSQTPQQLQQAVPVGERQLERQFKTLLGITPKHYQRILRVKNAINYLKDHSNTDLVELAIEQGFSDQAHMTREFKRIARITPKQFSNLIPSSS